MIVTFRKDSYLNNIQKKKKKGKKNTPFAIIKVTNSQDWIQFEI